MMVNVRNSSVALLCPSVTPLCGSRDFATMCSWQFVRCLRVGGKFVLVSPPLPSLLPSRCRHLDIRPEDAKKEYVSCRFCSIICIAFFCNSIPSIASTRQRTRAKHVFK